MNDPHVAAQITWSRMVNTRGGPGHTCNAPLDLHSKHLNLMLHVLVLMLHLKQSYNVGGASKSSLMDNITNFDKVHSIQIERSIHIRQWSNMKTLETLEELTQKSLHSWP